MPLGPIYSVYDYKITDKMNRAIVRKPQLYKTKSKLHFMYCQI